MQHGFIQLPLPEWSLTPHTTLEVQDLLSGERYYWRGDWNYVRLDPQAQVAHVLQVRLPAPLGPEPGEPLR
jgi:starch synthase (maltosyl-transferring)